jgi:hypothetical protein
MPVAEETMSLRTPTEAVSAAKAAVAVLFAEDAASAPSLEAISKNGGTWEVALSFTRRRPLAAGALGLAMDHRLANYRKTIKLSMVTGEVIEVTDD